MIYEVTCLTPTLVGDGQKLAPIDYMVWKDHVNVLDQRRIIKLLAKGPRLEGYLAQVRKAEKLDFASWGGFAQNFAGRRIPFEHTSLTGTWERQHAEHLFIPTFASGPAGPYLPASALRGALHTALMTSRWSDHLLKQLEEKFAGDRLPRRPAELAEDAAVGGEGYSRMRSISLADSVVVPATAMKVFLVRTSTLVARGGGKLELGWKQAGRGTVDGRRADESTPIFCEMAPEGTTFRGKWSERAFLSQPEVLRALRWKEALPAAKLLSAANESAKRMLALHKQYAETAGLRRLNETVAKLEQRLAEVSAAGNGCLLPLGWGGGFLSKAGHPDPSQEGFRRLLRQLPYYARAIQSGLPFPKTRRIVFQGGEPATLPGWVELRLSEG
jgi:CRISPR-associated protein Csm5